MPDVPTVIVEDVSPVDQLLFVGYDDVKSTVVPAHIVVDLEGVIVGAVGVGFTDTVV